MRERRAQLSDDGAVSSRTVGDRPTTPSWRGLIMVCLAGTVWGTIGPAVQLGHERSPLSPPTISGYRAIAAVATLVLAALATRRLQACLSLARSHWRRVIVVGTLTATYQLLFFVAVVSAGVSVTTVVSLGFAPVLLLVVTSAQHRRLPSIGRVLTVTAALLGLLLVSVAGSADDVSNAALGIPAALASGAAYALSAEFAPPLSKRHDGLTVTTLTMSVAAALLVPVGFAWAQSRREAMTTTDAGSWLLLIYLGVVTMAFAYVLLFAGLRTTASGAAVVATLLEPVTAVLIAVSLLDERLTPAIAVGSLLIIGAIASLGRQAPQPPPQ
jgi:drug/metabolite transporter, DME family